MRIVGAHEIGKKKERKSDKGNKEAKKEGREELKEGQKG